jgi:hypothetical protein
MSSSKRVTFLKAAGGFVLAAAIAGMAVAAGPVTTLKRPAVAGLSDATKARLKGAGLDPADPGLATKLQAKLRGSEASFLGAHVSSIRIAPKKPQVSSARSMGGGAPAGAASSAFGPTQGVGSGSRIRSMLENITLEDIYSRGGTRVTEFDPYGGYYYALVSSKSKGGDGKWFCYCGAVTVTGPCGVNVSAQGQEVMGGVFVATDNGSHGNNLKVMPAAAGKDYFYVRLDQGGLNLGASPRNLTVSVKTDYSVWSSISISARSQPVMATITLTIDAAPPFFTNNTFGIGKSNGLFANPGATRLDPGTNPNASTGGDDKVGVAVNLGPGWSVTGTKIVAAHSVLDAPNDSTPDNSYRGASVTQTPSSGRLETTVHWHYGAAESLSYTIEWQLQGPGGQRPLLTMPLGGPCDS